MLVSPNSDNASPATGGDTKYHLVSGLVAGTKKVTLDLYEQVPISLPPSVEAKIKRLNDVSSPVVERYAQLLDTQIDTAIARTKDIVTLTRRGLEKLTGEERLLVEMIRTWISAQSNRELILPLQEFFASLKSQGIRIHLGKIKQRITVFYDVSTSTWQKLRAKHTQNVKEALMEVTAKCLCEYAKIGEQDTFVKALLEVGLLLFEAEGEEEMSLGEFLNRTQNLLGVLYLDHAEPYNAVATKFYKIIIHFKRWKVASGKVNSRFQAIKKRLWPLEVAEAGLEFAMSTVENLVGQLHSRVTNEQAINGEGQELVKAKSFSDRALTLLCKLDQVRSVLQAQITLENLKKVRLLTAARALVDQITALVKVAETRTTQVLDLVYLPAAGYSRKLLKSKGVLAITVFVNEKKEQLEKVLEKSKVYERVRAFFTVVVIDNYVTLSLKVSNAKTLGANVMLDVQQLLSEVCHLLKTEQVRREIPSKVYQLAVSKYRARLRTLRNE
eukprot:TRINITY_DN1569_c0_g1_i1.p1 TRINITY_DN1569_c0_g1~~TRINITY_DN1569_c0_g1_i1.p1  ORF type:complete len:499 (+),score=131.76 TRINITY_DN1569_c0_g1_i1:140-1636(+)